MKTSCTNLEVFSAFSVFCEVKKSVKRENGNSWRPPGVSCLHFGKSSHEKKGNSQASKKLGSSENIQFGLTWFSSWAASAQQSSSSSSGRADGERPPGERPDTDRGRPDGDRPDGDRTDTGRPDGGRTDSGRDRPDGDRPSECVHAKIERELTQICVMARRQPQFSALSNIEDLSEILWLLLTSSLHCRVEKYPTILRFNSQI